MLSLLNYSFGRRVTLAPAVNSACPSDPPDGISGHQEESPTELPPSLLRLSWLLGQSSLMGELPVNFAKRTVKVGTAKLVHSCRSFLFSVYF